MNITITARKTTIKDSFKERVEKKLAKLDRFFDDDAKVQVTVTNERDRETVEVTVQSKGMTYRSEKTSADRLDSLDGVVDALFRQIVKNKERLRKNLRENAFDAALATEEENGYAPDEFVVVRSKHFPVKPMAVEEAILQLNIIGHEFYMFQNASNDEINVVYRRKDGTYGLIEPVFGGED